jgi:HAD superfamily hydrolase (TIGR01509 family)
MPTAAWDLVIFDNDGVLVDSEVIANSVLAELLSALGHPTTMQDSIDLYLGGSIGRVRQLIEATGVGALPADFEQRYEREVFARFERDLRPVDGVVEALDAITAATCVASSGSHERIRRSLTRTGLIGRFDPRLFSASDVERGKPAPDLFLHAARAMGAAPARTVVVEDSPLGVAAAVAAGMRVAGFSAVTPAVRLADATVCFDDMRKLPGLLDDLAADSTNARNHPRTPPGGPRPPD